MPASDRSLVASIRDRIRAAAAHPRGLCVLTGAGMSAESGIPTFRDARSGLWARFDPMALATEDGFRADPKLVWDWYAHRREGVRAAEPNAGHRALADFAKRHPGVLTIVTQNVDDLHQRAGNAEAIRLHGDILRDRWLDPCPQRLGCEPAQAHPGRPPTCARCGNRVRPGVVWPAVGLAAEARAAGAWVAMINPEPSDIDAEAHALLRGTAAGVLPEVLAG